MSSAKMGGAGASIRIVLADPENSLAAEPAEQDADAMCAKIQRALTLYRSMAESENVEIRCTKSCCTTRSIASMIR